MSELQAKTYRPEDFMSANISQTAKEQITRVPTSLLIDGWMRLKRNRGALIGLIVLTALFVMALVGPHVAKYTYHEQHLTDTNKSPSAEYYFGTDHLGRDMFARAWEGLRVSMLIAFIAASLDLLIGLTYGSISAFYGGRIDNVMQRIIEVLYGIPNLIVIILMMMILQPGIIAIAFAMVITGWVPMARIVRGQILKLKNQEYIMASRTLGASNARLIWKHLIPNTLGPVIVNLTFTIPTAIFFEAVLSFIGLGLQPPNTSLGVMINEGFRMLRFYPHETIIPGAMIALLMLGFNLLGDGLRDAFDPKLRR
ncbi:ABC transporter permease [Numidum massiliense]|uniref:ABC transporter permease n=1 Tax=Numidum massiliense TaxID=1522315 RepID=UPI0006D5AD49|nr:ABC transporter permease [Numidum massiliense]